MKYSIPVLLMAAITIVSCHSKNERPATAIDTGRTFIRATLDGDFNTAETLLYEDSMNTAYFELYKTQYDRKSDNEKEAYKKADYIIKNVNEVNDSVNIINYSNSYMKQPQDIKVIRKNGQWQIDFKYTASGDSTNN